MAEMKNIQLTDDPLTNIHIMVPMLNEEERKAVSYLMYGCFIGKELANKEIANQPHNPHIIPQADSISKGEGYH